MRQEFENQSGNDSPKESKFLKVEENTRGIKRPHSKVDKDSLTNAEGIRSIPQSIFGQAPTPDLVEHVRMFLKHAINSNMETKRKLESNPKFQLVEIEIEAKLGTIIDRNTNKRIQLPVYDETVCTYENIRFNSDMSMQQHQQYNQFLNSFVSNTKSSENMRYEHTKVVDEFITTPEFKIRRTRDHATKELKRVIYKKRLSDLNIFMPTHPLDIRISVNLECVFRNDCDAGRLEHQRIKDRLSYASYPFQVDLTQVKNNDNVQTFN